MPYLRAGERHNRLTALEDVPRAGDWVLVRCDCGTEKRIRASNVRLGHAKSCGCLRRGASQRSVLHMRAVAAAREFPPGYKHGLSKHPLYPIWNSMVARCTRTTAAQYHNYGGRGITVCDRWLGPDGPANFIADMGPRPSPRHSVGRIDGNGNYEPPNCTWQTPEEQRWNQRPRVRNSDLDRLTAENNALKAEITRLQREVREVFAGAWPWMRLPPVTGAQ